MQVLMPKCHKDLQSLLKNNLETGGESQAHKLERVIFLRREIAVRTTAGSDTIDTDFCVVCALRGGRSCV